MYLNLELIATDGWSTRRNFRQVYVFKFQLIGRINSVIKIEYFLFNMNNVFRTCISLFLTWGIENFTRDETVSERTTRH